MSGTVKVKKRLQVFYRKVEETKWPFSLKKQTVENQWTEILKSFSFGYSKGFLECINEKNKSEETECIRLSITSE